MSAGAPRKSLEPWLSDSVKYYHHQVEGVRWGARHKNFLLADDMGTGKSLQALTTFVVDVKRGWAQTLLIVCPVSLKGNWAEEIEKFTTIPHTVLEGGPMERLKAIAKFQAGKGPRILIAHYEQVMSEGDLFNALKLDCLILDEAHVIRGWNTKRTKAVLDLWSHRTLVLTGTPMLNGIAELWPLLHKIDPAGYPDFHRFTARYVAYKKAGKGRTVTGTKNEAELIERLHKVMLRRMKHEVLDLPEVQIIDRMVDLYEDQQEYYDSVMEDFQLPGADADDEKIDNALTRFLRAKQICGTLKPFTGEDVSAKMDMALVDDAQLIAADEKIIVFTQFRDVQSCYVERLRRQWPDLPIFEITGSTPHKERVPVVNRWSSVTGAAVIVCMIQVAGVGLNMTASKNVSFLDELFVPGLNQQGIDRAHRIGADLTQPVTVRKYICRGTIENRIRQILKSKSKLITGIVETDKDWKRKLIAAMGEDDD